MWRVRTDGWMIVADVPNSMPMSIFSRSRSTQSGLAKRYGSEGGTKHVRRDLGAVEMGLMTVGGVVGSGLFLASGQAIRDAGPSLVIAYLIGATVMAIEVSALAEMSASDPEEGSFLVYARRALGPGWTFVGGWIFWFSSVLNLAAEATAAAIFTRLWLPHFPTWAAGTLFALVIVGINFLTVRGFGAIESAMAAIKLVAVALFVALFGAAIFLHWPVAVGSGLKSWSGSGGFFPHGLRGIGAAMILVMFSMAGTGVLGLAAPSARRPRRTLPRAVRGTVASVYVLYIGSALAITAAVPIAAVAAHGQSPFVAALSVLKVPVVAQIFNVVILLAVLSAMNAGLFATDRVLAGLAHAHDAPKALGREYDDNPRVANAATGALLIVVTLLTYFLPKTAFLYLVTATGFQALFVWLLIVLTHIRYRPWLERNRREHLVRVVPWFPYLSWAEIVLILGIIATAPLAPRQLLPLGIGLLVTAVAALVYLRVRASRGDRQEA